MATKAPVPTVPGKSGTASEPPSWMQEYDNLTDVDQAMIDALDGNPQWSAANEFAARFGVAPASPVAPGTGPGTVAGGGDGSPPTASTNSTPPPVASNEGGDATKSETETGGEGAPPAATPAATDEPTEATTAESFKFTVDGQELELTQEQVVYLLQQNTWLQQQRPETVAAWGQIEAGTHLPVAAEEYQQFQAWKATGSPTSQSARPARPDLSLVDPEVAEYISSLESAQPKATPTVDAPSVPNLATLNAQAQIQAQRQFQMAQDEERVIAEFAERYGLDEAGVQHLKNATVQSGAVAMITNRRTTYSPTGQLLSRAPFDQVLAEAFESTIATDPTLRQIRDDYVYNQRLAKEQETVAAVNRKKALAGSLASVPSAAVPSGNNDPATMTPGDTTAAIANALREAQAAGTFGT